MKETLNVKNIFKEAIKQGSFIEEEFDRLSQIEGRIVQKLEYITSEIKKTENARNYNSILGEALKALDAKIRYLKEEANKYNRLFKDRTLYTGV